MFSNKDKNEIQLPLTPNMPGTGSGLFNFIILVQCLYKCYKLQPIGGAGAAEVWVEQSINWPIMALERMVESGPANALHHPPLSDTDFIS